MEDGDIVRTRVARRRFNNHTLPGDQLSLGLCDLDHSFGDSVLH